VAMETKEEIYDIAIVGASIAGLISAYFLSKTNLKIIILEQKKEIGSPVCCGEAISKKALENLDFSAGSFIDTEVKGFRIYFPNKKYFYVNTGGYILNRDKFEKNVADFLLKKNIKIYLRAKVIDIKKQLENYVIFTDKNKFYSKFLIGADGPVSTVDKILFKNKYILIDAIQFKIKKEFFPYKINEYLNFYYDNLSKYYFWVFEKQNEINIGGAIKEKNELIKFINKYFPMAKLENSYFSRGKIPVSWIKNNLYKENCFLTGDAAGLTNPVSFAGIYSAIISARICAECISMYNSSKNKEYLYNYEKKIKKKLKLPFINFVSKHCYNLPEDILNFIGNYFDGANYRKKDFVKFFKMSLNNHKIYKYIIPLALHRELLRYYGDKIW